MTNGIKNKRITDKIYFLGIKFIYLVGISGAKFFANLHFLKCKKETYFKIL